MSELKYACPVCGQHMMCDSTQSGTTMECPTCFQKIVAPQAPSTADPKFIITGTKVGERPIPAVVANAGALPAPRPEKSFPGPAVVFVVLFFAAAATLFVFHGKIFKSSSSGGNHDTSASNANPTPVPPPTKPITGPVTVVLAKGNSIDLGGETGDVATKDPAQTAFLAAFKANLAHPLVFEGPFPLTPLVGGRTVPGATGQIQYHGAFPGGLVIGITLAGLAPNHAYLLTLNGDVQHAGNNNLPDQLSRTAKQKYYDFIKITTDANGGYQSTFGIVLPPGPYDVYFFVKDTTDWKIVLSYKFFNFTVE